MKSVTLGGTGITVPQNAFGCLPIQRVTEAEAVHLLRKAYAGGMRFFDTAHVYSDSEKKMGAAFDGFQEIPRDQIYLATKTQAKTPEGLREDLETSLRDLRTDYIDLFQLHCVPKCFRPGDGTGVYEALLAAKRRNKLVWIMDHGGEINCAGISASQLGTLQELGEKARHKSGDLTEIIVWLEKNLSGRGEEHGARFKRINSFCNFFHIFS